jgi:tetratricopeptide (TPR) repeat protein
MVCPHCGSSAAVAGRNCPSCGRVSSTGNPVAAATLTPPPPETEAETRLGLSPSTPHAETQLDTSGRSAIPPGTGTLTAGEAFGRRYRILRVLGQGGMGVVYQAWDEELGLAVALKTIRPEVMSDPVSAADVERRFKRELLLARQVTHRHVVRIHDLGEVEGVKYLTMPFIEGQTLSAALTHSGKLPVGRALQIVREIADGLLAAHGAGVVHRDLKPENVMLDGDGHAIIMDFGISRSLSGSGAGTAMGSVVGTLEYMAPEQARGEAADQRADIYAVGLMLYDMLVGRRRLMIGTSPMSEAMARMQQAPPPLRTLEPSVPEPVERIVARCLEPDAANRYQTVGELVADLDGLDPDGHQRAARRKSKLIPEFAASWPRAAQLALIAAIVLLAVLPAAALVAILMNRGPGSPGATGPTPDPVSVLITDFSDPTNDPVFKGTLEQGLALAVEESSFVTVYPRASAQRLAQQIKPGSSLDATAGQLISLREGIKVILSSSILPRSDGYSLTVTAIDPANGNTLTTVTASASSKADVLRAIGSAASDIREALGDANPESTRQAAAETFTAASLEAARDFSVGQELASAGKHDEAIASYRQAIEKDPNFGRAYASWATSAAILGRREESAEAYKHALSLVDRMTEREKYRTLGTYYLTTARNYEKAVENYTELVRLYPADRTGHHNLALAHFYLLDFRKALEEARLALEIYPKNETSRNNYALYAMYAGDFDTAAAEATKVIDQNPNVAKAYLPLAMGALARGDLPAARSAYERMSKAGAFGASLASMGSADLALYQSHFAEAEAILKAGITADEAAKNTAGLASKLLAIAETYAETFRTKESVEFARRALKLGQDEAIIVPAAGILLDAGLETEARALASSLGQQLQPQRRAYAKILDGEIALKGRQPGVAVNAFREGQKIADVWLGRFDLGVAYVEAGHYAEALAELEIAHKRRAEVTAIFLDDVPSFRRLVPLYYWLARAQQGLGISTAEANYKTFLLLRPAATKNPLAVDAERRLRARGTT